MMDLFSDISNFIGTEDLSSETCQTYLDEPAGSTYDHSDVLVPNVDSETLNEIIKKFKSCKPEDLAEPSSVVYIKRFAAAALSTVNNSSDADAIVVALRLLLLLCTLPGASAYGVCNNNILSVVSNNMGKLCTIGLKAANKRLTSKEKDLQEDKKMKKKQKSDLQKAKKNRKNDDQEENEGYSDSESETENSEDKETYSQFTQASQSSQPLDEGEEIESSSRRRVICQVSYPAIKKLLSDFKANLSMYTQRVDERLNDSCVDALVSVLFLSAVKPDYSGLLKDSLSAISMFGTSSESAYLTVYRSMMPALTTAGRDVRLPDGSKVRVLCHKAAVQVMLSLIASSPQISWGVKAAEVNLLSDMDTGSPHRDGNVADQKAVGREKEEVKGSTENSTFESDEIIIASPAKCNNAEVKSFQRDGSDHSGCLTTSFICVVGALQRMTVNVPDKSNWRTLVLNSILRVLHGLQTVPLFESQEEGDEEASQEFCPKARLAGTKYLTFLQKLSKSNKIGFRAFSLDIITECMGEKWIWSIPLKTTESAKNKFVGSAHSGKKFFARSLLSLVLLRCNDVAPTVRIRALGALCGLLEKLKDKGHANPLGMCSSVVDLALGFLEEDPGNYSNTGISADDSRERHEEELLFDDLNDYTNNSCSSISNAGRVRTCNLFEILRLRIDDDKPLVRVKAIQAFAAALGLNYPKCTSDGFMTSQGVTVTICDLSEPQDKDGMQMVSMPITPDDVTLLFDRCGDRSLSTRKQALTSLSDLVLARPADAVLQDAWVTGCLSLASDPESSVQIKLAQCAYELIISPSLSWSKGSIHGDSSSVENGLGWVLCCKISSAGQSNLLRIVISTMLRQGVIKSLPGDGNTHSNNNLSTILKAVKKACCDESTTVSRGGWVLLEALVDNDGENSPVTATMEMVNVKNTSSQPSKLDLMGSSNFVFDCFFRRQEEKLQFQTEVHGSLSHKLSELTALDQDDERILKVLKKITDSISLPNLMKTKTFLLSVVQSLAFTPSLCTIVISTLFSISKSIAKSSLTNSKGFKDNEDHLQKVWYSDVTQWSGQLLLTVYRALHTAVWGEELEESKLYDLFCTDHNQHVSTSDITRIPSLSQAHRIALSATFERTAKDSNGFESSFWTDKFHNDTDKTTMTLTDNYNKSTEKGREMIISCLFLLGEISMLGFSLEEDECVTPKNKKDIPDDGRESLSFSQNSSNIDSHNEITENNGKECTSVIRAHAFVTMGKFCLREKNMARSHVNIFLRELHCKPTSNNLNNNIRMSNPSVRSNALFVLGDMCVRYTNLVDRHIGVLAVCLQDRSVLVRKHALILLTQLLLQDYIKWRGLLLFRFLATAIDKDEEMAEFAKSVLQKTLNVKYPDFFAIHFSECILVMNGCTDHPVFTAVASSGADGDSCAVNMDGVDIMGPKRRNARLRLYGFMMEDFTEEQKIQVAARIVQDLLAYAVDYLAGKPSRGESSRSAEGCQTQFEEALKDSFLVLQSPLLKVGRKANHHADIEEEEDLEEGGTGVGKALQTAKNKVLKKISLQHLLVHMLPVVTSLKHVLETSNSHLQRALMDYLVTFVRAHKAEVYQAMALDPTLKDLKAEIDYEIKLLEKSGKGKITRNRLSSEGLISAYEQTIEGATFIAEGSTVSPSEERADSTTGDYLATPQEQLLEENDRDICSKAPLTRNITPFKNSRDAIFPSPLKSSKKSIATRTEKSPLRSLLTDAINEESDEDRERKGEDEEAQASRGRLSRRRSWGVVMSNLCDEQDIENIENVAGNLPLRIGKGKGIGTSKDLNSRKGRIVAMKAMEELIADIDVDFEVRFTPLKKRTSGC